MKRFLFSILLLNLLLLSIKAQYLGYLAVLATVISSSQEDYIRYIEDNPTELIDLTGITASRDSACMFDTIVLTANAKGEKSQIHMATCQRLDGWLLDGSEYRLLKITPQLNGPYKDFQLSAGVDIPVWRRVGGIRMSNNRAIQLNFAYNIKL